MYLNTRNAVPQALLDAGGNACANAQEVAEKADTHLSDVARHPGRGAGAFAAGRRPRPERRQNRVDMSSISPMDTGAFAAKINALGCQYMDAPALVARWAPRRPA